MSWIEDINTDFIIITGDGREYNPLWVGARKTQEYNVSEFEFVDVPGALVRRKQPKARRFDLLLKFQGDDNLVQAQAFEESSRDNRVWQVSHPMYGTIFAQPLGLFIDDDDFNVTSIKVTIVETILDDAPRGTIDPVDTIEEDTELANEALAASYADNVTPDTEDINSLTADNATMYNDGSVLAKTDDESSDYFNAFNTANADFLEATSNPLAAMRSLQAVIAAPSLFAENVRARIDMFEEVFNKFGLAVPGTTKKSDKILFESKGGTLITSMCLSLSLPLAGNYTTSASVFGFVNRLLRTYNRYLTLVDSLQTPNGGQINSYIPNYGSMQALSSLVNFTLSNLFSIALNAKQERFIFLEKDSNVIELAHRFYGLDIDDLNIQAVIDQNNISLLEILKIKKGRRIVYYV